MFAMDSEQNISDWAGLADALQQRPRGSAYRLAQLLNMNSSLFYRKVGSRKGELTVSQAKVARDFLAESDQDMASATPHGDRPKGFAEARHEFAHAPRARAIPLYGFADRDQPGRLAYGEGVEFELMPLPHGMDLGPGAYAAVRMLDPVMEPRIFPGETVVARINYPPARERDVVVEFKGGGAIVRTYITSKNGRIYVKTWNPDVVEDYDATTVKALHAVVVKL
jgi:phage repressor protein C with HTH and peptisase S24 domain